MPRDISSDSPFVTSFRRMEGVELFPRRDERGVCRFDLDEHERVARRDRSPRRGPKPHRTAALDLIQEEAEADEYESEDEHWWREWAKRQRQQVERLEATRQHLEAERTAERRKREQEQAEWELTCLEEERRQLVESFTSREVRRLSDKDFEELTALLES